MQAPNFSLENLAGERVSLKDLKQNGPVLVNFWATWCAPCKAEVPLLNQVYQRYQGKRLTVVGISVEERKDMVSAFCRKNNVKYPVLLDSKGTIAKRYGIIGYPTSFLVNPEGAVLFRETGILDERMNVTLDSLPGENKLSLQTDGK